MNLRSIVIKCSSVDTKNPRRCVRCGFTLSWAEERHQFGRAIKRYGLTPDEAKSPGAQCALQNCSAAVNSSGMTQ
jgi:hypothetical protein